MNLSLESVILIWGPLGVGCVVLGWTCRKLYRDLQAERTQCQTERKQWMDEKKALEDRYITKAETWMEKHGELARGLNSVLESAVKKRSVGGGDPPR